jgi:hypothetical protein
MSMPANAALAIATAQAETAASAPEVRDETLTIESSSTLETDPPPGFGDLVAPLDTLFDLYYLGNRLGTFRAVLDNGRISFSEPQKLIDALTGRVSTAAIRRLLDAAQPIHESFRCFPGQTANCGVLPPGQEGLIADPERFAVELFFRPEDVIIPPTDEIILGPASTGPSLIQTINFSAATAGGNSSRVRFGATLDTAASVGQSAFLARTIIDDQEGTRLLEATGQHVWGNRIIRGGLFEDFSTRLLTSFRIVGAEFASFYPRKAYESGISTPIQIVLPREADVELRRNGVLVSVRHYGAGAQILDTAILPEGSYPLEVIALSGGAVVFQDTRAFTKAQGLPVANKTEFSIRAGFYAPDNFVGTTISRNEPFFPRIKNSPIVGARARRRIGNTSAIDLSLLHIDDRNFAEASLTTVRGNLQALVTGVVGDDGSYGALATGTMTVKDIRFTLSGRYVESSIDGFQLSQVDDYRPFARSEKSVFGSIQFPLLGGSLSTSAGYTDFSLLKDDYSVDVRYSRTIGVGSYRPLLSIFGRTSNRETRMGATLSFLFGLDRRTNASVRSGGELVTRTQGQTHKGFSPVIDATISRLDQIGSADVVNQIGVSTNADTDRAFASTDIRSSFGQMDATAQYQNTSGSGGSFTSVFANGRTGFAIGGGKLKVGLADIGQAIILSDIAVDDKSQLLTEGTGGSGYRIKVNRQPFDRIKPGETSAVGVAAYEEYEVELEAENAPAYDIDTSIRRITLYPGNVAYFKYEARNSFAIYGRVVDHLGKPYSHAAIRSGSDRTSSDSNGYFLLSVAQGDTISIDMAGEGVCRTIDVASLLDLRERKKLYRVGDIMCEAPQLPPASSAENADAAEGKIQYAYADVVGLVTGQDNTPLRLARGVVTAPDDANFGEHILFTNDAGKFGLAGLAAGKTYQIKFVDIPKAVDFAIPTDARGIIQLGVLKTAIP